MKKGDNLLVFALAAHGKGISGGDRILIEFVKRWSKKINIEVIQWEEGNRMFKRVGVESSESLNLRVINMDGWCKSGFLVCYVARILAGIKLALTLRIDKPEQLYLYSASEFWMD